MKPQGTDSWYGLSLKKLLASYFKALIPSRINADESLCACLLVQSSSTSRLLPTSEDAERRVFEASGFPPILPEAIIFKPVQNTDAQGPDQLAVASNQPFNFGLFGGHARPLYNHLDCGSPSQAVACC